MDSIYINNLRLYAYHGVNQQEKVNGQYFLLDIVLKVDLQKACTSDDITDTVSYSSVVKTVTKVFQHKTYNLIECAAQEVADAILNDYPPVKSVSITLKKPDAPIAAEFGWVGVQIVRDRKENC